MDYYQHTCQTSWHRRKCWSGKLNNPTCTSKQIFPAITSCLACCQQVVWIFCYLKNDVFYRMMLFTNHFLSNSKFITIVHLTSSKISFWIWRILISLGNYVIRVSCYNGRLSFFNDACISAVFVADLFVASDVGVYIFTIFDFLFLFLSCIVISYVIMHSDTFFSKYC